MACMDLLPDTEFIDGVVLHARDGAVLTALAIAWQLPEDELIAWEVGVRNLQGEVYRRAALKGVAQMLYFEERLAVLGFVPELEDHEYPGSGFDVIFRDLHPTISP